MRTKAYFLAGVITALAGATSAEAAACTGGVGSTDLSCTSSNGTLNDYRSWIESVYVPEAVQTLMSSFAAVFNPALLQTTGKGWAFDEWGQSNKSNIGIQVEYPQNTLPFLETASTTAKAGSDFFIDGVSYGGNGANVYFKLSWNGTTAEVVNGATNYIASYTYILEGLSAWGATEQNGSQTWLQGIQVNNLSGSGTYNFSGNTIAVPGPEAGAGLGALALGGLGVWLNRRRKTMMG